MAARGSSELSLGAVMKRRRRQLEMTQSDVAKRVGCRPNYIGYLETGARHPSNSVVAKLARALDLDHRELYFLANPLARSLIAPEQPQPESAWGRFEADRALHARYRVTRAELATLRGIAALGHVRRPRDFLFVLQSIRQALNDE